MAEKKGAEENRARGTGGRLLRRFLVWREASVIVVAVLLVVYFEATNSNFITGDNLQTLSQFIAAPAIIAIGEILLLICREIDLSAGQTFALAPFIVFYAAGAGLPVPLAIVAALVVCALLGLLIGLVTVGLGVPSFITTLGTLFLINGLTLTISGGFPAGTVGGPMLSWIMGNAPYAEIIWAVLLVAAGHVLLRRTRWGMHTIAVGDNLTGAAEAGINVARIRIGNFMITTTLAGFAGILEAFRIGSTDPLAGGSTIMFLAVAAGVIGGTALTGGSGTIIGGLLGAIVLGVLQDGFTLQGINAFTFDIIIGLAILLAMISNVYLGRIRGGRS
jgi:simple sugar transport system permease protein